MTGKGSVDTVNYFIGDIADSGRGSDYEFDTGYMPIPTVDGAAQCTFSAQRPYKEFSYLTVPPMFCYTFDICGMEPKLAFGLVADPGQHNYTQFNYDTSSANFLRRFWLWTDQSGHTHVDGEWKSPSVIVYSAPSRHDALKFYSDYYFATGRAEAKPPMRKSPAFGTVPWRAAGSSRRLTLSSTAYPAAEWIWHTSPSTTALTRSLSAAISILRS